MTISVKTKNGEETLKLGSKFGRLLKPGAVVALTGELGAGKTLLTKGIVKGAGLKACVKSPTFVLLHIYRGKVPVYHYDCYRLKGPADMEKIGYEEYFYGKGITIIEWPDRVPEIIPANAVKVIFKILRGDNRKIEIDGLELGPKLKQDCFGK